VEDGDEDEEEDDGEEEEDEPSIPPDSRLATEVEGRSTAALNFRLLAMAVCTLLTARE
jgi:hypothetical protein